MLRADFAARWGLYCTNENGVANLRTADIRLSVRSVSRTSRRPRSHNLQAMASVATYVAETCSLGRVFPQPANTPCGYMVMIYRLCHRYQQATLRYGSQRLAIFSICSGFGNLIFRGLVFDFFFCAVCLACPFFATRLSR